MRRALALPMLQFRPSFSRRMPRGPPKYSGPRSEIRYTESVRRLPEQGRARETIAGLVRRLVAGGLGVNCG